MINHKQYINSPEWELKKESYYSRFPKACNICKTLSRVQLHHKTYVRIGEERDEDLVPLCRAHHEMLHKEHQLKKNKGHRLEDFTDWFIKSFRDGSRIKKSRHIGKSPLAMAREKLREVELGPNTIDRKRTIVKLENRIKYLKRSNTKKFKKRKTYFIKGKGYSRV